MDGDGIVRAARRPAGWVAPGPPPAPPQARAALRPGSGEDLCYLAGEWRIFQRLDGHRWSLDDLVTAWMACREGAAAPPARAVDLGCGIGTVLLLLAWRFPAARAVGIEAQALSVDLARRSIAWNGVAGRCRVVEGDFRAMASSLPEAGSADLVTATPPYLPPGTAIESARPQRGPATIEHRGGIEAYCRAAAEILAPDGRFVVCAAAGQDARVRAAAAATGIAVARHRPVIPRAGKPPLFAVHVLCRGDAAGAPAADPPLVVRDARGQWTDAFRTVRREMGLPA
jgi:tRNA1Val (adenine37-N6)-methyltransferase